MTKYTIEMGMRVEAGNTMGDYDTGEVIEVDGREVTVRWDSEQTTTQDSARLRPAGTDCPPDRADLVALRDEAREAGDDRMADICEQALCEEDSDLPHDVRTNTNRCWRAISEARARVGWYVRGNSRA